MKNKNKYITISIVVFLIDQLIKMLIMHYLKIGTEITIIPKFFSLHYVKNTGAAFSILENNTSLLIIISVLFLLYLNHYLKREENMDKKTQYTFAVIIGGIYGNLIDRIIHHGVIDYLSFTIFSYQFPIFNFADTAISLGIIFLLLYTMIDTYQKKEKKNESNWTISKLLSTK